MAKFKLNYEILDDARQAGFYLEKDDRIEKGYIFFATHYCEENNISYRDFDGQQLGETILAIDNALDSLEWDQCIRVWHEQV